MTQPLEAPIAGDDRDTARGFGFALTAYLMWGFLPLYLKALTHVPPVEVIAHRIVWSVPVAGLVLLALRRVGDIPAAFGSPRTLGMAAVTAALISVNWCVYVWAIANDRALDAALGYYINPLFSVVLGAVFLGERLDRLQIAAVMLAAAAVALLTWEAGRLPAVALALTVSWGFYGYFKKSLPIGPNQGFLLEVLLLTPPAIAYIVWLAMTGQSSFLAGSATDNWLLLGCGLVTAVPLLIFANGAKLLRLSTIGIMQYIAPTMIFLIAVFVFDESYGGVGMIAFPMIWAALVLYSVAMLRQMRRTRRG
ncbi:MAG: EamA family transporter RarD [Jhaorihella sp.]